MEDVLAAANALLSNLQSGEPDQSNPDPSASIDELQALGYVCDESGCVLVLPGDRQEQGESIMGGSGWFAASTTMLHLSTSSNDASNSWSKAGVRNGQHSFLEYRNASSPCVYAQRANTFCLAVFVLIVCCEQAAQRAPLGTSLATTGAWACSKSECSSHWGDGGVTGVVGAPSQGKAVAAAPELTGRLETTGTL